MKKKLTVVILILLSTLVSCSDDDDPKSIRGFQLANITANLDGSELISISASGAEIRTEGDNFEYNFNNGLAVGTWSVDEQMSMVSVSFDGEVLDYILIQNDSESLIFQVKTFDFLDALTKSEQNTLLYVAQKIAEKGTTWDTSSLSSERLDIILTLKYL